MAEVIRLSSNADLFPNMEVEYTDLLSLGYVVDGRAGGPAIDCIGVVLEVLRRAGLGLPDPKLVGGGVLEFTDLFERVEEPLQLYDLVNIRRASNHVAIVVRQGLALSARERAGVYTVRINQLRRMDEVEYFRLLPSSIPS